MWHSMPYKSAFFLKDERKKSNKENLRKDL